MLLFPPFGLWLLWGNREFKFGRKFLGTLGALFYSVLYAAGIVVLLMQFTPLEVEWRGGFPPVLTFAKTKPDYARSRRIVRSRRIRHWST